MPLIMDSLTVRDVVALYLRHSRATDLHKPNVLAERTRVLGEFVKLHGDKAVDDCKAYLLSDWIEDHEAWHSISTRKAKANMVRAAFGWALDGERINRNPFASVRYGEAERRPDMPEELIELIATIGNKAFEKAVRFLRLTGCRLSELAQAKWQDVDLEKGIWTIHLHKSRKHTKKDKLVALVPEACDLLLNMAMTQAIRPGASTASLVEARPADSTSLVGPVFLNTRGRPWKGIALSRQFARLKERYHIQTDASLHGIRHKFGTATIAAGAPIKLVSQQLGHSSVVITEQYYCDLSGEIDSIRNAIRLGIPKKT